VWLKPRGTAERVPWEAAEPPGGGEPLPVGHSTPLDEAEFVALDVETTGNSPFLVLEIGAERFRLSGPLGLFDTLVDCRAPINSFARRRHQISRDMLVGAPGFADARRAFLGFARGAALVEHSHDAFDSYLIGRGLKQPLEHPGQTPGLAAVVAALAVDASPAHAALSDARATAAVFRELVRRAREQFGWRTLGDLLDVLVRPAIDRSALEVPRGAGLAGQRSGRPRRRERPRPPRPDLAAPAEQAAEGSPTA